MEAFKEKRHHPRYEYCTPIFLNRMDSQDLYHYAEMKDYGQGGMSLKTNEKLVVGHLVYLEMKNFNESATGPEKYKGYRGRVKWISTHSSSDTDVKGPYTYGVEYSEPASYH